MTKILIALLFKDSIMWLNRFFGCIEDLLKDKEKIDYDFSVIYGDSKDGTDIEVKKRMEELKEKYLVGVKIAHIPLPKRLDSIEKLAILRNASIAMVNIKDYDYVLQIDTDIIFDSYDIHKLIKDIKDNIEMDKVIEIDKKIIEIDKKGVIAPLIIIEDSGTFYDTFAFRMNGKMFRPDINKEILDRMGLREVFDVDSVGTLYICRSDIFWNFDVKYGTEKIKIDISKVHPNRKYESEQVVWCNNVRKITKYRVCVDPNIVVRHINLEKYGKRWH